MIRKFFAVIICILGLLLSFAGLGLITLAQNFLLYLGMALLLLSLFFFFRG